MLGLGFVSIVAVGYLGLLFAIASFGDRHAARLRNSAWEPVIYALSLGVYCTSWTFYGSVGRAASNGLDFVLIYVGPMLVLALGYPFLQRVLRIARTHNITSIADFLGARYGKSQPVAALATVIAVVGVLPYIALQLQAVTLSFDVLVSGSGTATVASPPFWRDTGLYATLAMALFAIIFGLRHVHSSERHQGLMVAIAFESLVKLGALLAVGLFVMFMFGGSRQPAYHAALDRVLASPLAGIPVEPSWVSITLVAACAFVFLPRQFHVSVVESGGRADNLRLAVWLFPLYLVAINLFVPAIAAAGLSLGGGTVPDMFVLMLPTATHHPLLSLAVFIGGLSASTSMVIVEGVALSTMICNELVVPLVLRKDALRHASGAGVRGLLLGVRRSAVLIILLGAYAYHMAIGDRYPLASIGLISFAAVAQFAPPLIAGMYWSRAHRHGAVAGLAGGALIWAYALLLPSLLAAGWLSPLGVLGSGSLPAIFVQLDPLTNGVFWSLLVNTSLLVGVSLVAGRNERDRQHARAFVAGQEGGAHAPRPPQPIHAAVFDDLKSLAERLVGRERAERAFAGPIEAYRNKDLAAYTERLLSGAIGAASAHIMVAAVLRRHRVVSGASRAILDEASEAILFNHDLLRATLENVSQGMGMFDSQQRLAAWNGRFVELLDIPEGCAEVGAPLQRILGGSDLWEGDPPSFPGETAGTHRVATHTRHQRRRDGRMLEFQINPINTGGFVLVCSDITAQVHTLEALREANELLEVRVAERTRELTLLNRQLAEAKSVAEAASVGKTRFVAAASHDLLQPLHVARLLTGALAERNRGLKTGALVAQLEQALSSVDELLRTILDISKLDSGALRPQLRTVDINEVLASVVASFEPLAAQRQLQLRVVPAHAVVLTDPVLLRRILQNFLSNAVRYTRAGRILIGCRRRSGRIVVEVWDTGRGIPEDQLGVIFEEFRRGMSTDPDTPPGLGLGLAIVDRIARLLDHPVAVRSWPGQGSVFSVALPPGKEAVPLQLIVAEGGVRNSIARKVILCVDDDPAVLAAMRTLLEGWSCEVLTARSPMLARAQISARPPDLILIDYHLEGDVNGLEAIGSLLSAAGPQAQAVLITANYTEAVREAARAQGYPLLNKPVRPGALRALLSQLVQRGAPGRSSSDPGLAVSSG
jgi:Na+/proline symporter/signal transduction histidine kinase/CheY-like chemotaxis protein